MSPQLEQKKQIAIIGGGPSGLSLARMLQVGDKTNQYVVKVYERDLNAHVRIEGGSLDLHEDSGQIFIDKAGLRSEYDKVARIDGGYYTLYTQDHEKVWENAVPQQPEMDRNDIRTLLVNSLNPGTVVWNKHFIKIEQGGDGDGGYLLHFKGDDQPVHCDIVIGADGANSKIRHYIAPQLQPLYTGVTVIQGDILNPQVQCPELLRELHQGNMWAFGQGGRCLGFQQKGDGSIIFFLSFRVAEDWMKSTHGVDYTTKDNDAFRRAALSICNGYAEIYLDAIKTTDKFMLRKSYGLMYGSALDARWNDDFGGDDKRPAITLVGDAGHLMPFFGGVGVNNAMMDTVELAEELYQGRHADVRAAFSAYEKRMIERCIPAAEWTERMENNFHIEDSVRAVTKVFSGFGTMELDDRWKYLLDWALAVDFIL